MASLVTIFIVLTALIGWLAYSAWDDYGNAFVEYTDKSSQLGKLSQQKPFPNKSNLTKLDQALSRQKSELGLLVKELQRYTVPAYGELVKAKPQDRPQQFQDALRKEVTRIKSLATGSGATLPPGFYLGMEEFENKPPSVEESLNLAKQLTILNWLADNLVAKKGIIIAEFSRMGSDATPSGVKKESVRKPVAASATKTTIPYETISTIRISFRGNQNSFRELINTVSSAPYFLLIEGIQVQNSSGEPPLRNVTTQAPEPNTTGIDTTQRLPIVVGRELLNVSMKIRALEFPESLQSPEPLVK